MFDWDLNTSLTVFSRLSNIKKNFLKKEITVTVSLFFIISIAVFILRQYNCLRRLNRLFNFSVRQYQHG